MLSIAWMTPFVAGMLWVITCALFTFMRPENIISISNSLFTHIFATSIGDFSFKTHNSKDLTKQTSMSDFVISFKNSSSFEKEDSSDEIFDESDTESDEENAVCKLLSSEEFENCSRVNLKWATLYIQMTYCQQTLKQWLDKRNHLLVGTRKNSEDFSTDSLDCHYSPDINYPVSWTHIDKIMDMFTQLVRGLNYIHSRGVIHHDVKPSNVFVEKSDSEVRVLLGDFGLACPLQQSHRGVALGTQFYAAPEQLDGQCNPKSDMYSLGIILLEMVQPFSTDMERVKTIEALRKGQIPANLTANYPKIAHIIGKLVQRRPSKRLDTNQLLDELQLLSVNKDDTIKVLRDELAAKDEEIAHLKMMLAKCNINS
nr:eukaryotic translation initiation factor 2-alpha kinase 1-like [Plodia interpunctella]